MVGKQIIDHEDLETVTFFDDETFEQLLSSINDQLDQFIQAHPDVTMGPLSDEQLSTLKSRSRKAVKVMTFPEQEYPRNTHVQSVEETLSIPDKVDMIEQAMSHSDDFADSIEDELGFDPETGEELETNTQPTPEL